MFKALSRAKIGFNIHIDAAGSDAGNMRLFETTGVGACLVTDWKENLKELFEPGKEVVTYRSAAECIEKIKWLLDNPLERENIARAGQNRTLHDHTYERRAAELDEIVRRMMP
jgi:spore maturation protein CgeB